MKVSNEAQGATNPMLSFFEDDPNGYMKFLLSQCRSFYEVDTNNLYVYNGICKFILENINVLFTVNGDNIIREIDSCIPIMSHFFELCINNHITPSVEIEMDD